MVLVIFEKKGNFEKMVHIQGFVEIKEFIAIMESLTREKEHFRCHHRQDSVKTSLLIKLSIISIVIFILPVFVGLILIERLSLIIYQKIINFVEYGLIYDRFEFPGKEYWLLRGFFNSQPVIRCEIIGRATTPINDILILAFTSFLSFPIDQTQIITNYWATKVAILEYSMEETL